MSDFKTQTIQCRISTFPRSFACPNEILSEIDHNEISRDGPRYKLKHKSFALLNNCKDLSAVIRGFAKKR